MKTTVFPSFLPSPSHAAIHFWLLAVLAVITAFSSLEGRDFQRPSEPDGAPTKVYCAMGVLDVDDIDDANQSFTVNVFASVRWFDPREAHEGDGSIRKKLEEVWHPSLLYLNRQRLWSSLGNYVEISPEGEVVFRNRVWGNFSQPMKLHDFPFDQQHFDIRIVFAGSEGDEQVEFLVDPKLESFVASGYSVADWKVMGHEVLTEALVLPGGGRVPSFTLRLRAERLSQHYVIKVIAPLLMIVLLSWVVFWLSPTEGGSQLGVAVTAFLTVIAFHVALGSKLPEISYLTRLDVFVFGGTIIVFLAMIEVVITTGLAQKGKLEMARWLDRVCRFLFPALLVLGSCYAFLWH